MPFALQNRTFSRGEEGEKVLRKGAEEGGPAKGTKRKKGRVKTGQLRAQRRKQTLQKNTLLDDRSPHDAFSAPLARSEFSELLQRGRANLVDPVEWPKLVYESRGFGSILLIFM